METHKIAIQSKSPFHNAHTEYRESRSVSVISASETQSRGGTFTIVKRDERVHHKRRDRTVSKTASGLRAGRPGFDSRDGTLSVRHNVQAGCDAQPAFICRVPGSFLGDNNFGA